MNFSVIRRAASLPESGGSYLLLISLTDPLTLPHKRFKNHLFSPGRYVYAGSANGPGGLRARMSRHIRQRKKKRWHVDYLTTKGRVIEALAIPGANECMLLATLLARPNVTVPLPKFGSSDCQRCVAHLVEVPADLGLEGFAGPTSALWRC